MSQEKNTNTDRSEEDKKFPLPIYKAADDIYRQEEEVPLDIPDQNNSNPIEEGLYTPGTELDDAEKKIDKTLE